jgi:hypothetical protein
MVIEREAMRRGPSIMAAMDRAEPLANPTRARQGGTFMRTLRLSLAGMVITALLGGASAAVVAQDETDGSSGYTPFTGTTASCTSPTRCEHGLM